MTLWVSHCVSDVCCHQQYLSDAKNLNRYITAGPTSPGSGPSCHHPVASQDSGGPASVAFVLMTTLVGRVGGPRGTVAIYFVPVVAILLGALLFDDRIAPMALAGTALVLLGAALASRGERSATSQ